MFTFRVRIVLARSPGVNVRVSYDEKILVNINDSFICDLTVKYLSLKLKQQVNKMLISPMLRKCLMNCYIPEFSLRILDHRSQSTKKRHYSNYSLPAGQLHAKKRKKKEK